MEQHRVLLTNICPLMEWQQQVADRPSLGLTAILVDDVSAAFEAARPAGRLFRFYENRVERRWFRPRREACAQSAQKPPLPVLKRSEDEQGFWGRLRAADVVLSVVSGGLGQLVEQNACRLLLHFGAAQTCPWDNAGNSPDVLAASPQTAYGVYAFSSQYPGRRAALVESFTRTERASQWKSKNTYCWRAADYFERALARLDARMPGREEWAAWTPPRRSFAGTAVCLLRLAVAVAALKVERVFGSKSWGTVVAAYQGLNEPAKPLCAIPPPKGRIWVDPFIVRQGDGGVLFYENLPLGGRAEIWAMRIGADGGRQPPVPALQEPFHLSFPNVFQLEGKWYMLPETLETGQLRLYEAEHFPDRWKLACILMEGIYASDAVLHRRDGLWWLFVSEVAHAGMPFDDELSLYYTANLFSGGWTPHPANPLVSDVRCARMAGNLFEENGRLIRPAQDCAGSYGQGLNFFEITRLSPKEYCEVPYRRGEDLFGRQLSHMHTFSQSGGWCAVDALVKPGQTPDRI